MLNCRSWPGQRPSPDRRKPARASMVPVRPRADIRSDGKRTVEPAEVDPPAFMRPLQSRRAGRRMRVCVSMGPVTRPKGEALCRQASSMSDCSRTPKAIRILSRTSPCSLSQPTLCLPPQPLTYRRRNPAAAYAFLSVPIGYFGDWHPSPKRQWVFFISGQMEFEVSDGARFLGVPGSRVLLEDTTGRGHRSRVIGSEAAVMAAVQL